MLHLIRAPCGDNAGKKFLGIEPTDARGIPVALEHDERSRARGISGREQRGRRERTDAREEDRLATGEIVKHGGDAVGPLRQGR